MKTLADQSIDSCGLTAEEKAKIAFKSVSTFYSFSRLYSGPKLMVKGIEFMLKIALGKAFAKFGVKLDLSAEMLTTEEVMV